MHKDLIADALSNVYGFEAKELAEALTASIDMVLHCPECGAQHIDKDDGAGMLAMDVAQYGEPWRNPPHRTHLCHSCGHKWRPADVATNGVAAVKTRGKDDSPIVTPRARPRVPDLEAVKDKRMSELTPAQRDDAQELWVRADLTISGILPT